MHRGSQHQVTVPDAAAVGRVSSRPNPVEPDSLLKRTASSRQGTIFQYASNEEVRKVLHKDAVIISPSQSNVYAIDTPQKRKLDDGKAFDLPKLPVRSTQERRQRLPPTLSGLHQPPPDARLLPSISVDKPELSPPSSNSQHSSQPPPPINVKPRKVRVGRNRWTDEETRHLIQGVSRFGIGNWTKILNCSDYKFNRRTALDLKDRFRVCYPEQYGGAARTSKVVAAATETSAARPKSRDLFDLGTRTHFPRSTRRQRNEFTKAEDERLVQGFHKYGKSWSSIQQDTLLGLGHRTRTDLRDRMRNKHPDLFKTTPAGQEHLGSPGHHIASQHNLTFQPSDPASSSRQNVAGPMGTIDTWMIDPYLSINYEDDSQAITLDRGILDWPFSTTTMSPNTDVQSSVGVRSDADLTPLPSLVPTLRTMPLQSQHDPNVRELPALAQFLTPPLEIDNRSNVHAFLSLDELLS